MATQSGLYALMFVAGCAVPTMAAINASLGARLGSATLAVFVLCGVATLLAGLALLITTQRASGWTDVPLWQWTGGALFLVYIFSATYAVPHIGLGNAIFLVLLGQLMTAAVIDHFGLLGAPVAPLSARRALGLVVMGVGCLLYTSDAADE